MDSLDAWLAAMPVKDVQDRIKVLERELEVLRLMTRGLSNAEIASELIVSGSTVKTHVAHVLQKLRLRDRVHAIVVAYETGLIQPGADR